MISVDIYDYAKYPSKEEWVKLCGDKVDILDKLGLENNKFSIY